MIHSLLQDPYHFTIDQIADMTNEQIAGIFGKQRRRRRRSRLRGDGRESPRDAAPASYKDVFIQDMMESAKITREQAESLYQQAYPDDGEGNHGG